MGAISSKIFKKKRLQAQTSVCYDNGKFSDDPTQGEGDTETNQIPIADKHVTIKKSHGILSRASGEALAEITATGNGPNFEELVRYDFQFENAVFEGGGVKGISYIGAVKV